MICQKKDENKSIKRIEIYSLLLTTKQTKHTEE